MTVKPKSPTWPYLALLSCLFALAAMAPRTWERIGQQPSMASLLHERRVPAEPIAAEETALPPIDLATPSDAPEPLTPAEESSMYADEVIRLPIPEEPEFTVAAPAIELAPLYDIGPTIELPQPEPSAPEPTVAAEPELVWPVPVTLITQLQAIQEADPESNWARDVSNLIHELCYCPRTDAQRASTIIADLRTLAAKADIAPVSLRAEQTARERRRARRALARRLDVWQTVANLGPIDAIGPGEVSRDDLLTAIEKIEALGGDEPAAKTWREYLQIVAIREVLNQNDASADQKRQIARETIRRIHKHHASAAQRAILASAPVMALAHELGPWAAEPVDPRHVLETLERYEQTGTPSDARSVAIDYRSLRWSADPAAGRLADDLDNNYRDANVRVAISGELLNRMLPPTKIISAPVRDTIIGARVRGVSTTEMKLTVRLVPDDKYARLGLEATGAVRSDTTARSGPATVHSAGQSQFLVRKLLTIGPNGLMAWPAIAEADNYYNGLKNIETDYDGVPLLGRIVQGIAHNRHDESRGQARGEVERKMATRARGELDSEINSRLARSEEKVKARAIGPVDQLGLLGSASEFSTTEQRITMRTRLADDIQLAAHTERPWAPSDSWFSLQLHESALNNVLDRFDLNGKTFSPVELAAKIREKLDLEPQTPDPDAPEGVRLTFADQDALRVRLVNGRLELVIALAELTDGESHRWRDFTATANFKPTADGYQVELVRDGTISLGGKNLKGTQVVLRGVFSKLIPRDHHWRMVDEKVAKDSAIKDLAVSQLTIEDGWLGLAYSLPRAEQSDVARKKSESRQ